MVRRVVGADVAADGPPVPHLHVGDLGAHLTEDRARAGLGGCDHFAVRRHRTEDERAVGGELDSPELVEILEVDEDVGRRGP